MSDENLNEGKKTKTIFRSSRVMTLMVAVLAIAVCVEGYYLYGMRTRLRPVTIADHGGFRVLSGLPHLGGVQTVPGTTTAPSPSPWTRDPFFKFNWNPFGSRATDPFQGLNRLHQQMQQLLNQTFGSGPTWPNWSGSTTGMTFSPRVDMTEDPNEYVITIDAPGTTKSNLDVKLEDRTLTISGKRDKTVAQQNGGRVIRRERMSGEFQRSIELPGPVQQGSMTAKYKNGVLTVTIKKATQPVTQEHVRVQ